MARISLMALAYLVILILVWKRYNCDFQKDFGSSRGRIYLGIFLVFPFFPIFYGIGRVALNRGKGPRPPTRPPEGLSPGEAASSAPLLP